MKLNTMNARKQTSWKPLRRAGRERGSFLLEALISILIVAFGVLGLIGLQARAIQNVDDAQYRGEAAYLANALIGQMWASKQATLAADFDNTGGGAAYTEFKAMVDQRLPGATALDPVVTVAAGPTATSSSVLIRVFWMPPGELAGAPMHRYEVGAIVGAN